MMICDATDDVNVSEAPCLTSSNQHMTEFHPYTSSCTRRQRIGPAPASHRLPSHRGRTPVEHRCRWCQWRTVHAARRSLGISGGKLGSQRALVVATPVRHLQPLDSDGRPVQLRTSTSGRVEWTATDVGRRRMTWHRRPWHELTARRQSAATDSMTTTAYWLATSDFYLIRLQNTLQTPYTTATGVKELREIWNH